MRFYLGPWAKSTDWDRYLLFWFYMFLTYFFLLVPLCESGCTATTTWNQLPGFLGKWLWESAGCSQGRGRWTPRGTFQCYLFFLGVIWENKDIIGAFPFCHLRRRHASSFFSQSTEFEWEIPHRVAKCFDLTVLLLQPAPARLASWMGHEGG